MSLLKISLCFIANNHKPVDMGDGKFKCSDCGIVFYANSLPVSYRGKLMLCEFDVPFYKVNKILA